MALSSLCCWLLPLYTITLRSLSTITDHFGFSLSTITNFKNNKGRLLIRISKMDDFMAGLLKHGIRASAPGETRKRPKQIMQKEDTNMDIDTMEDVQMANGDSNLTIQDAQMTRDEGVSLCTMDDQQEESDKSKPQCLFLSRLPGELRQHIYEQALTDFQMHGLIYKHPDITHPSRSTQASQIVSSLTNKTSLPASLPTEDETESQITKMVDEVIKFHPFILLQNHQITSEYSGAARKYIIHALAINVTSLPLLRSWSSIPRNELARVKLTIDFGRLTNDVDHARVREHIVAFVASLPNLVDLQLVYKHDQIMSPTTHALINDWQTVRYELVYDLLPLLKKKLRGKKEKTVKIFPFVTARGGWNRVQFP